MIDAKGVFDRLGKAYNAPKMKELSITLGKSEGWAATLRNRGGIPFDECIKASKTKGLSMDYLLFGTEPTTPKKIGVPFYNVEASAGGGALVEYESVTNIVSFSAEYLQDELNINAANAFMMRSVGDSMLPAIASGSLLLINKDLANLNDGIYVLRVNDSILVKRLQFLPRGVVNVMSDNKEYATFELTKSDFESGECELIGRVAWVGSKS